MISRVEFLVRKAGSTKEEFQRYWHNIHAPIKCRMKHLRKYEQNIVVGSGRVSPFVAENTELCGYSELWFDNADHMQKGIASLYGADRVDLPLFAEQENWSLVLSRDNDELDYQDFRQRNLIKLIVLISCPPEVSEGQLRQEWWSNYAKLTAMINGQMVANLNLVIDRIIDEKSVTCQEIPIAGIAELWFDNNDTLYELYAGKDLINIMAPNKKWINRLTTYIVETYPIRCLQPSLCY